MKKRTITFANVEKAFFAVVVVLVGLYVGYRLNDVSGMLRSAGTAMENLSEAYAENPRDLYGMSKAIQSGASDIASGVGDGEAKVNAQIKEAWKKLDHALPK